MKKLFTILFCLLGVIANADDVVMALLQPRVADGSDPCRPIEMNMVRGELRKAFGWQSEFQVVTRTDLDQIVKEIGFQQSGMVTENQRKTIGEMTGAQYICVSTITKEGTQLYIESYLVDVETGQMTNPATQYANIPNNDYSTLKEPCNELAREMLGELDGGKKKSSDVVPSRAKKVADGYEDLDLQSGTPPKQSVSTSSNQNSNKRIVIPEIINPSGGISSGVKSLLRNSLTYGVVRAGYQGYDRFDMEEVVGKQSGYINYSDIHKMGAMMGAKYVLVAETATYDDTHIITAKLIDVETLSIVTNSAPTVLLTNDLEKTREACTSLVAKMLKGL